MLFQYRYFWRYLYAEGSKSDIKFCILSDSLEGLEAFEKRILSDNRVCDFSKEYLCQYDCSKLFIVQNCMPVEQVNN